MRSKRCMRGVTSIGNWHWSFSRSCCYSLSRQEAAKPKTLPNTTPIASSSHHSERECYCDRKTRGALRRWIKGHIRVTFKSLIRNCDEHVEGLTYILLTQSYPFCHTYLLFIFRDSSSFKVQVPKRTSECACSYMCDRSASILQRLRLTHHMFNPVISCLHQ